MADIPVRDDAPAPEAEAISDARGGYRFAPSLHILSDPEGLRAESIRALGGHLMASHVRDRRRSLAIGAPAVGAGCTYVATNLAIALARAGLKTLLIDGNLRAPDLHNLITPEAPTRGLVDYLDDPTLARAAVVQENVLPSLSLIYAGQAPRDPQDLLGGPAFKELIDLCLRDYDLTIIDTPAGNTYADARRIAATMRYALVVACRDRTFVDDVRTFTGELQRDRAQVVGTYLNDY